MNGIEINQLSFEYPNKSFSLSIDHLTIASNERLFIDGDSGAGKTTLLNLITGLIRPSHGVIRILGTDITTLSPSACDQFRATHLGVIFQMFNLIPYLSGIENILLATVFSNHKKGHEDAKKLWVELGLDPILINQPVGQLSIGQQQRVAIARALIRQPTFIIADEPTSALDQASTNQFMDVLFRACDQYSMGLLFVSHDASLQSRFDRRFRLNKARMSC